MSNNQQMKLKVIAKLIAWGNNPTEAATMVESNFQTAIGYGYSSPAKIAEYIRVTA